MSSPALPSILSGPAIVQYNGQSYYTKTGIKRKVAPSTFMVKSDGDGTIDERLESRTIEISFTPVGMLVNATKFWPYNVSSCGLSLFGPADDTVTIWTKAGQKITYQKGCISDMPELNLAATETPWGEIKMTVIGKEATQPASAGSWQAITTAAFADTTFDESKILTDIYKASWGASAPFLNMGSMNGFKIKPKMEIGIIKVDGYGVADMTLDGLSMEVTFAPSTLSEADMDTLLSLQGTTAIVPGQSLTKLNNDLTISADALTLVIPKAGPKEAEFEHASGQHRFKQISWVSRRTWTSGVANPLYTLTIN